MKTTRTNMLLLLVAALFFGPTVWAETIFIAHPLKTLSGRLPACTPLEIVGDQEKKILSIRLASGYPRKFIISRTRMEEERHSSLESCIATLPETLDNVQLVERYKARHISIGDPINLALISMGLPDDQFYHGRKVQEVVRTWRPRNSTSEHSTRFVAARSISMARLMAACEIRIRTDREGMIATVAMRECLRTDGKNRVGDHSIDHRFGLATAAYRGDRKTEAFRLLELLAQEGHTPSKYSVAEMLLSGNGVEKNLSRAVEFYHEAADVQYRPALRRLGFLYLDGTGVEKDPVVAYRYLKGSTDMGTDLVVVAAVTQLEEVLSPAQITQALSDGRPNFVTKPQRIEATYVQPRFPDPVRAKAFGGSVSLRGLIRADGSTDELVVISCTNPGVGFEYSSLEAVARWHYKPAMQHGSAVSVYFKVVVDYHTN